MFGIGNVPLFAGFMYSAVGSYIARIWRIFDFHFSQPLHLPLGLALVTAIYVNFFTHHYFFDFRYPILVLTLVLFARNWIYFRVDRVHRRMPLLLGWFLVALFIWIAENIATYSTIWVYPHQAEVWSMVPFTKLVAWFLLMLLSFMLVRAIHQVKLSTEIPVMSDVVEARLTLRQRLAGLRSREARSR